MAAVEFVRFDEVRHFAMADGVRGRPLFGDSAMVNLADLEPGAVVPAHSHPHEQIGVVLRGAMTLVVDGVPHEMQALDGCVLPGGVEHSATAGPAGALVLDVFCPVRDDYRARWAAEA